MLSKVAEDLKLNEKWGAKHGGGQKLDTEQTVDLLKKKIDVRQSPNSQLMDIRVKGDNAEEAANGSTVSIDLPTTTRQGIVADSGSGTTGSAGFSGLSVGAIT